jgi:4-hydroxy-tetrahydrodipicolinate reductase
MKKIKIIICGGLGRMGKVLIKQINKNKKFILSGITDIRAGKNIKNIKIIKNSIEAFENADVIIDFSKPNSSLEVIKYANKLKKKLVIGTTGFSKKQNNIIKKYSKKIAIFKSGNMSMGINRSEEHTSNSSH